MTVIQQELCDQVLKVIPLINTFQPPKINVPITLFSISAIQLNNKYIQRYCFHQHTYHELHFIVKGKIDYQFENGQKTTVTENQWILLRQKKSHRISQSHDSAVKITFLFNFTETDSNVNNSFFDKMLGQAAFIIGDIEEYHKIHILQLCNQLQQKNVLTPALCYSNISTVILSIAEKIYNQTGLCITVTDNVFSSSDQRFLSALQFIKDNTLRPITVLEVSEHCHLSTKHLNRIFQKEIGKSVSYHIQEKRIQAIQTKLLSDDRPLYLISAELGFCDEFYFSRFFTKMTNMSPSQYRMQNKDKNDI